ncbi:MAG: hypothetical protein K5652_01255 [Bacteroidales bacterium]|nr:hypothetical protein [Bacteroidales bacterium]
MKKLTLGKNVDYHSPKALALQLGAASVICVSNVIRSLALTDMTTIPDVSWDPED